MSIITPLLYLGDYNNARDLRFLKRIHVDTIVNCAEELPNSFPNDFNYIRLDLYDAPDQSLGHVLEKISDQIIQLMRQNRVVFVHCAAGISRSSSIVIYTIMKLHRWNYERAFKFVKDLHRRTDPNPGFVEQLVRLNKGLRREGLPVTFKSPTVREPPLNGIGLRGWSKLTFDCPECELPKYGSARDGGLYARIFS